MNISGILSSTYYNNVTSAKQVQDVDKASSTINTQNIQKPDAISSATVTNGGDHYFEAKA